MRRALTAVLAVASTAVLVYLGGAALTPAPCAPPTPIDLHQEGTP
jgi:hypothetical protein